MSQESVPMGPTRAEPRGGADERRAPAPLRPNRAVVAVAASGVGYSLVAGHLRKLTAPAELATLLAGGLVVWLALRAGTRRFPAPDRIDPRGALAWGAVLVVFAIWELYADLRGSTPGHPTLSILMGPIIAPPFSRAVGYVLWLAAGVWVVRR